MRGTFVATNCTLNSPPVPDRWGSASTSRAYGSPSCSVSASTPARTARSNSRPVTPAGTRTRSGSVLTKQPSASSASSRPATGVPMTRSSTPPYRAHSAANPVTRQTKLVSRSAVPSARSPALTRSSRVKS
ncbi:MAG: hypothetical protein AUG44_00020 [Actinobacteria bacterium 13_1_20CM_3_71_11]|nr:MAG: hypothetical protein AUG44_00020 [Actinobacteria bacterium 13_1_20CM_3_71_11]